MIELRWVVRIGPPGKGLTRSARKERVLQYRFIDDDGTPTGHLNWSDWRDVPVVAESQTSATNAGKRCASR